MKCKQNGQHCREVPDKVHKEKKVPSNQQYYYGQLEETERAVYQKNTLVWFVNSQKAIHSVTKRSPTTSR
eukprot:1998840-Pyramimonas_sp.AAC.1